MSCQYCGTEIENKNYKYCPHCGKRPRRHFLYFTPLKAILLLFIIVITIFYVYPLMRDYYYCVLHNTSEKNLDNKICSYSYECDDNDRSTFDMCNEQTKDCEHISMCDKSGKLKGS